MKPSAKASESLAQIKDLLKNRTQQIRAERGERPKKVMPGDVERLIRTVNGLCSVVKTLSDHIGANLKEHKVADEAISSAKQTIIDIQNQYERQ